MWRKYCFFTNQEASDAPTKYTRYPRSTRPDRHRRRKTLKRGSCTERCPNTRYFVAVGYTSILSFSYPFVVSPFSLRLLPLHSGLPRHTTRPPWQLCSSIHRTVQLTGQRTAEGVIVPSAMKRSPPLRRERYCRSQHKLKVLQLFRTGNENVGNTTINTNTFNKKRARRRC